LIGGAAVLLVVNGIIRKVKQGAGLPSAWLGLPAIGGVAISKN